MTFTQSTQALREILACHRCHGDLAFSDGSANCAHCLTRLPVRDGVLMGLEATQASFFDSIFEVMRQGNKETGTWELFYRKQAELVANLLRPGEVVVDVGCGPEIPYAKGEARVIGADASFASIRANSSVDLRLFASAEALPLKNHSVDTVLCFYSVHHMTGQSVEENATIVGRVFEEFRRVLKDRGRLLVFEVTPVWPFGILEDLVWNLARRSLGSGLDMYFWRAPKLERIGSEKLTNADLTVRHFNGALLQTFPPIFSKRSFRLPRFLYPFDICLYEWKLSDRQR